jgi:hypothetical protein
VTPTQTIGVECSRITNEKLGRLGHLERTGQIRSTISPSAFLVPTESMTTPEVADAALGLGQFEHAELTVVEQHLLKEHVIDGCTQAEFAERHGIPLQGVGGRKARLINTVRAFLAAEFAGQFGTEFLEILRRKPKRRLI